MTYLDNHGIIAEGGEGGVDELSHVCNNSK